jgi:hypothetical protein
VSAASGLVAFDLPRELVAGQVAHTDGCDQHARLHQVEQRAKGSVPTLLRSEHYPGSPIKIGADAAKRASRAVPPKSGEG